MVVLHPEFLGGFCHSERFHAAVGNLTTGFRSSSLKASQGSACSGQVPCVEYTLLPRCWKQRFSSKFWQLSTFVLIILSVKKYTAALCMPTGRLSPEFISHALILRLRGTSSYVRNHHLTS
jgi:hypothetical protein